MALALGFVALLVYLVTALVVIGQLRPGKVFTSRLGDSLWPTVKAFEPWQIKERLVERITRSC